MDGLDDGATVRTGNLRPRVVIVGAGFGGLATAVALDKANADVTVIDRRNHHLFQPLLYQVATAGLSPADIAQPIRRIVSRQKNTDVLLGEVVAVDVDRREVVLHDRRLPYDHLVIATGAREAYFNPNWRDHAPGLKTIEDATDIRAQILLAFERAEASDDADERRRLLTFVVVGGGPTGVELAGAIAELARRALAGDFRRIDPVQARIVLIEGLPRVLTAFPERLSAYAERTLTRLGVEVMTGTFVDQVDDKGVIVGGERIAACTVIWAAGVQASPAAAWLGAECDKNGRVRVGPDLSVPGHPEIFVIGDTAHVVDDKGRPMPGLAVAAKQQGRYVGALLKRRISGGPDGGPFHYRDYGNLATIGRSHAVVDFGFVRLTGWFAYQIWAWAHIFFLVGFRNKLAVMLTWIWAYFTFGRGMRLITGPTGGRRSGQYEAAPQSPSKATS